MATLFSFRRCPYAMRARMALAVSGAELELVEVSLKNKPQRMLDLSPKGTVPVVELDDGGLLLGLPLLYWGPAHSTDVTDLFLCPRGLLGHRS